MTLSAFAEPLELPIIQIHAVPTHQDLLTTPASVQKIVNDKAQQQSNVNLSEQLQGIAGLQVNNRENYAQDLQISMRGFGARSTFGVRGIRLYVDGIPATMPDGQGQSSNIDLNSLRQLEVLSGPFSSIYGNSSGGTILTQTQEGQGRDSLQLGYVGGSHGKQQLNVQLQGGSDQASQPAYVISSSYFDTDGYREHSAARKALHNAKLTWNLDDGSKINWVLNHVDIRADDAAGLSRADWKADRKQQASTLKAFDVRKTILQTQTGLTWTKPIDAHNELYSMAYLGNRQVQQYQSIPQKPQLNPRHAGGVIDFDRNYYGVDLRWKNTDWLPNTTIIAGLAYDAMQEDRKGYENFDADGHYGVKGQLRRDEKNTLWNLDPYVQASWQFLPAWHFNAGLRYSNVHYKSADHYIRAGNGDDSGRQSYDKVLPSVALGWNILPSLYSYISYAQGFETPTFTEMAYPTVGSSGMNFDLQASSSDTYEWGLKSQNPYGLFTAAVFQTNTKNDIVPDDANAGRSTFRNADKTLRQGVELTWQKDVWQDLKLRTSYSYLDATFAADIPATNSKALITKGTYIPGIAKNQAFASVAWQPQQGIQAGLDIRYMDKLFVDDMNSDQAPSYTVAGAYVGYVWRNQDWTLNSFARVDNLFDKDYVGSVIVNDGNQRFFEPADGRNVSLGLSIRRAF
nr:TonB-dependent receptor [Acinetobacter larvae]